MPPYTPPTPDIRLLPAPAKLPSPSRPLPCLHNPHSSITVDARPLKRVCDSCATLHPLPLPYIPGPSPPVTGVLHVRSLTHPSNRSPPFSRRAPPAGCVSFSLLGGFPRPPSSPSHATSPALTPASHPGTQVSCIFDIVSSTSPPLPLTLNSLFPLCSPTAVALLLATPTWLGSVPCYGGYSGASVAGGGSHTITFSCPAPRR